MDEPPPASPQPASSSSSSAAPTSGVFERGGSEREPKIMKNNGSPELSKTHSPRNEREDPAKTDPFRTPSPRYDKMLGHVSTPIGLQHAAKDLTKLEESSGFNLKQKGRFALAIFSGNLFLIISQIGKDAYVTEFGASAGLLGMYWIVLNGLAPVFNITLGKLMTKYGWSEKCGRFGNWFVFSMAIGSVGALGVWLGVLVTTWKVTGLLEFWFFFFSLLCWIGYMANMIIFDGARCNLFPYKEERVVVEGFSKVNWGVLLLCGSGVLLLFSQAPSTQFAVGIGIGCFVLGWCSLAGIDFVQMANQPGDYSPPNFAEYCKAFRQDANYHICLARFWIGTFENISIGTCYYYLTYVNELNRADRAASMLTVVATACIAEIPLIPFWSWFFSSEKRREQQLHLMQKITAGSMFVSGLVFFAMFAVAEGIVGTSVPATGMAVVAGLARIFYSPFPFWRISAQAWCVDEVAQATGKRHEALYYGLHAFWYELGRGFIASIIFTGLSFIGGMITTNVHGLSCLEVCNEDVRCMDQCHVTNIHIQPPTLGTYLKVVYMVLVPFCQFMTAYYIWRFPITGERLRALYAKQSEVFVRCSQEMTRIYVASSGRKNSKSPRSGRKNTKSPRASKSPRGGGSSNGDGATPQQKTGFLSPTLSKTSAAADARPTSNSNVEKGLVASERSDPALCPSLIELEQGGGSFRSFPGEDCCFPVLGDDGGGGVAGDGGGKQ